MRLNQAGMEALGNGGHEPHAGPGKESESHRSGRPLKVLIIDEELPYPLNAGKRIRTWNLLRRLARRHSICLVCYGRPDDPAADAVQEAGIRLRLVQPQVNLAGWRLYLRLLFNLFSPYPFSVAKHYSTRFARELRTLLEEESWDLLQCEWTPYARFVSLMSDIPVLMATHNVESQILARRAGHTKNPIARLFFRMQEWKMKRFERRALLQASAVTAVTALDVEELQGWGIEGITLIPNGVDLDAYSAAPDAERENEILALASLDWYPNVDALEYFIEDVFPLLRARRPEVKLRIVGRKPAESLKRRFSGIAGVEFVGEVENVSSHLSRSTVVVVPLRIGGGSRIKILEALAASKPVVSTSIGAEGLDVVSGQHLIVADSPTEFALRTEELLASEAARRELGYQGRKLVDEHYGWDGIASRLEAVWYQVSKNQTAAESISSADHQVHVTP
jgi:glycosyltransferase involved in cell wall biosynthesis